MTEQSFPWGNGVGDGIDIYDSGYMETVLQNIFTRQEILRTSDEMGVLHDSTNEFYTAAVASPVAIGASAAFSADRGSFYKSDAVVSIVVPTPAAATRIDRIQLYHDLAARTTRLVRVAGVEGSGVPPAALLGVRLWLVSITTGGVITLTDDREFVVSCHEKANPYPCGGRLTASSIGPYWTADTFNVSTLYFHPCITQTMSVIVNGALRYVTIPTNGATLSLGGLAANTLFDVFAYANSSGALALEATAWAASDAGASIRASSLALYKGLIVKAEDPTRAYIGTIRTTTKGLTEDSARRRYVWSLYNQVPKSLFCRITVGPWQWNSAAFRPSNYNMTDGEGRVGVVVGLDSPVEVELTGGILQGPSATDSGAALGIGVNSIAEAMASTHEDLETTGFATFSIRRGLVAYYKDILPAGYNFIQHLECGKFTGDNTWFGLGYSVVGLSGSLKA